MGTEREDFGRGLYRCFCRYGLVDLFCFFFGLIVVHISELSLSGQISSELSFGVVDKDAVSDLRLDDC